MDILVDKSYFRWKKITNIVEEVCSILDIPIPTKKMT
jgi:hypothetical protein